MVMKVPTKKEIQVGGVCVYVCEQIEDAVAVGMAIIGDGKKQGLMAKGKPD